ncbi:MAG: YraN family protein [Austwickia sp.]|jgi:putative endonuclease|nr:MAG: YraN family protein [Austwickia sp.]
MTNSRRRAPEQTGLPVDRRRQALGAYGERAAADYLTGQGLQILDRNWRRREGELDIVARDGDCLVVCEVKTRRTLAYGSPLEAVTWRKLARLRRLAGWWIQDHPELTGATRSMRVDVVGVVLPYDGPTQIDHLVGVLS